MEERLLECVVGGHKIHHLGPKDGLFEADRAAGFKVVDGVSTDQGPVCGVCLPVYEAATLGESGRADVNGRLADPEFVTRQLRNHARVNLLAILRDFQEVLLRRDVFALRDFLLRGIRVKDFEEKVWGETVPGLTLARALGCINDEDRTFKFIKGLFLHLEDLEGRKDEIEMVDGGCGPIPILGLMAALKSEKVRVTCIEVNPYSAKMAEQVIKNLGLTDRVKIVLGDAKEYRHDKPIDLFVSETMYTGLTEEPLAQIFANFASQVAENGVMVPEWVSVEAGLLDAEEVRRQQDRCSYIWRPQMYDFGPTEVLRLTRANLVQRADFTMPLGSLNSGDYKLALFSRVGLHDKTGLVLRDQESNITRPVLLEQTFTGGPNVKDTVLRVRYELGAAQGDIQLILN